LTEGFDYGPDGRLRNASLLDYRLFEQAMMMFSPFGKPGSAAVPGAKPGEEPKKPEMVKSGQSEEIAELKAQLASIQSKLEKLSDDNK